MPCFLSHIHNLQRSRTWQMADRVQHSPLGAPAWAMLTLQTAFFQTIVLCESLAILESRGEENHKTDKELWSPELTLVLPRPTTLSLQFTDLEMQRQEHEVWGQSELQSKTLSKRPTPFPLKTPTIKSVKSGRNWTIHTQNYIRSQN